MALRDILHRRAISVANGGIAEIDRQPSIEEGDAFDPEPTLDFASHNTKRHSRPARGGMAEVVTTMHLFDLTHISRCRCPA
jgi:hypothetical protein